MTETDSNNEELSILDSLRYYDELRLASSGQIVREEGSNVDVLPQAGTTEENTLLCHLSGITLFTFGNSAVPWMPSYNSAAAISLAAHQLNVGDGSIVPEISGLNERCNVRFTVEFQDTQFDAGVTLNVLKEQIFREPGTPQRLPCAFLGATGSAQSKAMSVVAGLFNYPQVSGTSGSTDLDSTKEHPLFARTVPSDSDNAVPIIIYFREVLKVTKLAVIHVNDPFGNAFNSALRNAAQKYAPDMNVYPIPLNDGEGAVETAIEILKETQYRYVFCLTFTANGHDKLLNEAYNQGVAGNGLHNWFFGPSFNGILENRSFNKTSPLHLSYQGVGLLKVTGGIKGMTNYDKFTSALESMKNPTDLQYLDSIFPQYETPDWKKPIDDKEFLSTPLRGNYQSFWYEATIALGLAACNAITGDKLDGQTHFDRLVQTNFTGVSGNVLFDTITGTREVTSTAYEIINFVTEDVADDEAGGDSVQFKQFNTGLFQDGVWKPLADYVFNDGTTNLPADYPPPVEVDLNLIPKSTKIAAFSMFGINVLVILICFGWLWWNRQTVQVRISQPFFLCLVLLGCLISSSTIIAMAQEDAGDGPVPACQAIPWLYSIGFCITFGTLFAKIRRIYTMFKAAAAMQRTSVSVKETLSIICAVLSVDVALLIVWTVIDPLEWQRTVTATTYLGEPLESQGVCTSEHWEIFTGVLAAYHLVLMLAACWLCYVSRHVDSKFSEGKYLSIAMVSNLQMFVIGIPIVVIVGDDPATSFFVRSGIVWMNDLAVVLLIFGNLMYSLYHSDSNANVSETVGTAVKRFTSSRQSLGPGEPSSRNSTMKESGLLKSSFQEGSSHVSMTVLDPKMDMPSMSTGVEPESAVDRIVQGNEDDDESMTVLDPKMDMPSMSTGVEPESTVDRIVQGNEEDDEKKFRTDCTGAVLAVP